MSIFREDKIRPAAPAEKDTGNIQRGVVRSAAVVSVAVFGSRVLGLVREQVFAAYFGAGFLNDAFQVGLRILNPLRDLFAEGALSVAFVRVLTDYVEKKGEKEAWRLASLVLNALLLTLSVVTLLCVVFAPQIIGLIAPLFPPEKARLAASLLRVMLPFVLLMAAAGVAAGVLNTKGRFGVPASASILFNVGAIAGGLACAYWLGGAGWRAETAEASGVPGAAAQWAITGMAVGWVIGGLLQLFVHVPSLWRAGFRYVPEVRLTDPGVRQVVRLMLPALVGTAAMQVNLLVNISFASSIDGGPSWLGYAFRLMQFPIGVFGFAVSTAVYPTISRYAVQGDMRGFRSILSSSVGLVFLLTIPSTCGLIVLSRPITAVIYQRGAFTATDTQMVAAALVGYALGLASYATLKVLLPAFYALEDARTPVLASLLSVAVNAVMCYLLMGWLSRYGVTPETPSGYAHMGLALATSCVALVNSAALLVLMRRKLGGFEGRRILSSFARVALASAALSAASYFTHAWLLGLLGAASLTARLVGVVVPIAAGGAVFFAAARLLRVGELDLLIQAVAERLGRGGGRYAPKPGGSG